MKLRISGKSIRMRVLRSEVAALLQTGRIEETIHLSAGDHSALTYALALEADLAEMQLRYRPLEVLIVLPREQAESWAGTEQVGMYAAVGVGSHGSVDLIVEKDFACLDLSDSDNKDTFPNPQMDVTC